MREIENLVLGAGIAGLAYANEKKRLGEQAEIFEATDHIGGLCHSFVIEGFRFDTAVHLSFTENQEARKLFDNTPYQTHLPVSYNYYQGLWMKHPIIHNLYSFPISKKLVYLASFLRRKRKSEIKNYGEWLRASYGNRFAEDFYYAYTRKYWTVEPETLSTDWVGKRLNTPSLAKIVKGMFVKETGNDYYAKEMRYPSGNGGFETFLTPLRGVQVHLKKEAVSLNLEEKVLSFRDGTSYQYRNLISSIPLPTLIRITKEAPEDLKRKSQRLLASKISLVSVGFNKEELFPYLWAYIYEKDILAARINNPSKKSKKNAPEGCSSLQFEIYHHPQERIEPEKIIQNVKDSLAKMGICKSEDILFMDYRQVPFGNVLFTLETDSIKKEAKEYLNAQGIKVIGRFGEWEYFWSDQSYLSGKNAAKM